MSGDFQKTKSLFGRKAEIHTNFPCENYYETPQGEFVKGESGEGQESGICKDVYLSSINCVVNSMLALRVSIVYVFE